MVTGPWRRPRLSAFSSFLDPCLVMFLCSLSCLMSSLRFSFCLDFLLFLGWSIGGNYLLGHFQKWNFWVISNCLAFPPFFFSVLSINLSYNYGELRYWQITDRCEAGTRRLSVSIPSHCVLHCIKESKLWPLGSLLFSLIQDCPSELWRQYAQEATNTNEYVILLCQSQVGS